MKFIVTDKFLMQLSVPHGTINLLKYLNIIVNEDVSTIISKFNSNVLSILLDDTGEYNFFEIFKLLSTLDEPYKNTKYSITIQDDDNYNSKKMLIFINNELLIINGMHNNNSSSLKTFIWEDGKINQTKDVYYSSLEPSNLTLDIYITRNITGEIIELKKMFKSNDELMQTYIIKYDIIGRISSKIGIKFEDRHYYINTLENYDRHYYINTLEYYTYDGNTILSKIYNASRTKFEYKFLNDDNKQLYSCSSNSLNFNTLSDITENYSIDKHLSCSCKVLSPANELDSLYNYSKAMFYVDDAILKCDNIIYDHGTNKLMGIVGMYKSSAMEKNNLIFVYDDDNIVNIIPTQI